MSQRMAVTGFAHKSRRMIRRAWDKSREHASPSNPLGTLGRVLTNPRPRRPAETAVTELFRSLSAAQKEEICFDWDYIHPELGHLRTFVANHWQVTRPAIRSDFYTKRQQWLIHDIFKGLLNPDWYFRFQRQLRDDTRGHRWGTNQRIALFGSPDEDKCAFLITGRHLTLRADGHAEDRLAFGGPIFYGHAATGFAESAGHPGNIFWPQGRRASAVFQMLDERQRLLAVVDSRPAEPGISFDHDALRTPGIPVSQMSDDQKHELRIVLDAVIEPFRDQDRRHVIDCLQATGGLEQCTLSFYREGNLGDEREWDNWRLTGPAFAWFFRGSPHVHVWAHVATDPAVPLNALPGAFLHPEHDPLT